MCKKAHPFFGQQSLSLVKYVLLLTVSLFVSSVIQSQTAQNSALTIFDSDGNITDIEDWLISPPAPANQLLPPQPGVDICQPVGSEFELCFTIGSGFHTQDINGSSFQLVACQVFKDLGAFLNTTADATGQKVRIIFQPYSATGGSLANSGVAYTLSADPNGTGRIVDNLVWQTLQSGTDAWTNVVWPVGTLYSPSALAHGTMSVNTGFSNMPSGFNPLAQWNTNLTSSSVAENFYDLYSVILHEATHILGFQSFLTTTGTSFFGSVFTRYDQLLIDYNGNHLLIPTSNNCGNAVGYEFNPLSIDAMNPECTDVNGNTIPCPSLSNCAQGLHLDVASEVPVFNPTNFLPGTSYSHLTDACLESIPGNVLDYFVMDFSRNSGTSSRFYQQEETEVLCALGYNMQGSFGGTNADNFKEYDMSYCDNTIVAGINDGLEITGSFPNLDFNYSYTVQAGDSLTIPASEILANDYPSEVVGFECLEIVIGTGILNVTSGNNSTNIIYVPDATSIGTHLLRYIPVYNGTKGNFTYIYVDIDDINGDYWQIGECGNSCNLIRNSGFETEAGNCSRAITTPSNSPSCWQLSRASSALFPSVFTRSLEHINGNNTHACSAIDYPRLCDYAPAGINSNTLTTIATDTYDGNQNNSSLVQLVAYSNTTAPSTFRTSYLFTELNDTLIAGNSYNLSFWAKTCGFYEFPDYGYTGTETCTSLPEPMGFTEESPLIIAIGDSLLDPTVFSNYAWNSSVPNTNDILALPISYGVNFQSLLNVEPIPVAIGNTGQDDWVFRSVIFNAPNMINMKILAIGFDIFNIPNLPSTFYGGVFIDDISLVESGPPVSALPPTICEDGIANLLDYVLAPVEGNYFTCVEAPEAITITDTTNVLSTDSLIPGQTYTLIYHYPGQAGCQLSETVQLMYDSLPCCNITPVSQTIVNPTCAQGTGSIEVVFENAESSFDDDFAFIWHQEDSVFTSTDSLSNSFLENIQCGDYSLIISHNLFECRDTVEYNLICSETSCCEIQQDSLILVDPLCEFGTGSIEVSFQLSDSTLYSEFSFAWVNQDSTFLSADSLNTFSLDSISCGNYSLIVTNDLSACQDTFEYIFNCSEVPCCEIEMEFDYWIDECLESNAMQVLAHPTSWFEGVNISPSSYNYEIDVTTSTSVTILENSLGILMHADSCGTYQFDVSDTLNHCSGSFTYTTDCIDTPIVVEYVVDIGTCASDGDQSIDVTVTGGSGVYDFEWTLLSIGGSTFFYTEDITDAQIGLYSLLVTDHHCYGNSEFLYIPVVSSSDFTATAIATQEICGFGEICIDANGGAAPYSYYLEEVPSSECSELSPGNYNVQVVDANGCSAYDNATIIPQLIDVFTAGSDYIYDGENWNELIVAITGGNLIIPTGTEADFTNVHFIFSASSSLVVEEGAQCFLTDCILTTCDNSWPGITLQNNHNSPEAPAAFVMIGGKLEYSEQGIQTTDIGVVLTNPQFPQFNSPQEGAFIWCYDVLFENNKSMANIGASEWQLASVDTLHYFAFEECAIHFDDEGVTRFGPNQAQVKLVSSIGYGFKNCSFENSCSLDNSWEERGKAIDAYNARFDIDDDDELNYDYGHSTITGFDFGIYAQNTQGYYNGLIIRETTFDNNRVAIFNRNVCFQTLVRNTINVGNDEIADDATAREGIVIDGGGFFAISENEIFGDTPAAPEAATIGIRVRDILTQNDVIYNNTIIGCNYANLANGQNSVNEEGVRYVCNHHDNSIIDILVSEFPEVESSAATICKWQSDLGISGFLSDEIAAGNTFTQNPGEWQIKADSVPDHEINYLYYANDPNQVPTMVNALFNDYNNGGFNLCSIDSDDLFPTDPSDEGGWTSDKESGKSDAYSQWLQSRYLYLALIDNGNTAQLINEIGYSWGNNVWHTRDQLLQASPYVSEIVLYELADETLKGFPQAVALDVFIANPNISTTNAFIQDLMNVYEFPSYMLHILLNIGNISSIRAQLEEEMAKDHMRFIEASVPLLRYHWRKADLTMTLKDSLLSEMHSLQAELMRCELYMESGDFTTAHSTLEEIPMKLLCRHDVKHECETFEKWIDLMEDVDDITKMDNIQFDVLKNLADEHFNTTAGKLAMGLLEQYYDQNYFTPPHYSEQGENRSYRYSLPTKSEVHFILLYPNPADEYIQLKLNVENEKLQNVSIQVSDVQGRNVCTKNITDKNQTCVINTSEFAAGDYFCTLRSEDRTLESVKFNVVH